MAISGSPPISFSTLSNEINVALPIAINHARLQALVGHNLPIAMSQFLGVSGRIDGNFATSGSSFPNLSLNSVGGSYYGATVNQVGENNGPQAYILFNSLPNYLGDLIVKNNTTGIAIQMTVISTTGPYQWSAGTNNSNWLRAGGNDNFTIIAA